MTGCDQLQAVIAAGKDVFARLRKKHPDLKAYLVLAHHAEQINANSGPMDILANCPGMVVDDAAKHKVLSLLAEKTRLEANARKDDRIPRVAALLADRVKELSLVPEVQIEIRFDVLKHAVVRALQEDPLVDRDLTPQTGASIRIVLGNFATLSSP